MDYDQKKTYRMDFAIGIDGLRYWYCYLLFRVVLRLQTEDKRQEIFRF